jgi:DNA topoisomerase-3
VTGFKGRSGRSFRAKLALEQGGDEDARWRVEFDEPWAKEGAKPPETAEAGETAEQTVAAGADEGAAAA